jgi:hypothetical protein
MHDEDDDAWEGLETTVPTAFSRVVKRPVRDELPAFSLETLKGERVVVRANGFAYEGVLIGADEGELYLRGDLRYVVLPLSTVSSVVPAPASHAPLGLPARMAAVADGTSGAGPVVGSADEDDV